MTKDQAHTLFERFRRDILYDAHSFSAKLGRSKAAGEIVALGREILPHIGVYLKYFDPGTRYPILAAELKSAWVIILKEISGVHSIPNSPESYDFELWQKWAEAEGGNSGSQQFIAHSEKTPPVIAEGAEIHFDGKHFESRDRP